MKYSNLSIPGLLLCLVTITACNTIKEFPGENPVDPTLIEVSFSLEVNMSLDEPEQKRSLAPASDGIHELRCIVDLYREAGNGTAAGNGARLERIVYTGGQLAEGRLTLDRSVSLPADRYRLLIWVDFVRKGTDADLYYNTQELRSVSIIRDKGYVGYTPARDAFSAAIEMDLTPFRGQRLVRYPLSANAVRPFGIYQIITTDIEKYLENNPSLSYASIQPGVTRFSYLSPFPTGYDVRHGVPDDFATGIGYEYGITESTDGGEALVASDMVFVNGNEAGYDVGFEICTPDGAHISSTDGMRINLRRNRLTVIRGQFLTLDFGGGGVGIDPGFDEEIIVPVN